MKLSTACAVLAAFAAAAAPARADSLVSTTLSALGDTFFRLIKSQTLIKKVQKRNNNFVTPAFNDISRELHQGLDSNIFQIGSGIQNTLVDVNLKVGQISGNATSMIAQIESVAQTVSTLQFSNARLDYNIKKNRIKKLCNDTLARTSDVLQLIDETKEMLGKGVSGPLKMLQLTIQLTSDDKLIRERANIQLQQNFVDNSPSTWLFVTDYDAVNTAKALKREGYVTIDRFEKVVTSILDHAKWLEGACQTIRENLDNDRTSISAIEGKISGASGSITAISGGFDFLLADSRNMSDNHLKEGSKALVQLMSNLKAQVSNITNGSDDYTVMETYQSAPEDLPPAVIIKQSVKPSWLDKTSVNGCFYIYNKRTTGCIFVKTFDRMKMQYTWLSNKFIELESLFKVNETRWNNLASQVLNVSKNTSHQFEAIKFVADLETNKLLCSDDIKKIRDLSVSLDSYAESLFSEANAQLKITRSNDAKLNEDILRVVNDNKQAAVNIIIEIENDISVINKQEAGIRRRFQKLSLRLKSNA